MSDTPTEPGYYWHRQIDEGSQEVFEWEVVQVLSEQDGPGIVINGTTYQAEELSAVWGPRIPDPDEQQEPDRELRDMFAAFALNGILAHRGVVCPTHPPGEVSDLVTDVYAVADAMIAGRNGSDDLSRLPR